MASTQNLTIPAGGTTYLAYDGSRTTLTQGWGQLTGTPGVIANVIYTIQGGWSEPNQDGTSPGVIGATRILVPFDATPGYATGIAIANPTSTTESVSVNIQRDSGTISQATLPPLPPRGQLAFSIAAQIPRRAALGV